MSGTEVGHGGTRVCVRTDFGYGGARVCWYVWNVIHEERSLVPPYPPRAIGRPYPWLGELWVKRVVLVQTATSVPDIAWTPCTMLVPDIA
eukprot:3623835-Rhodomonas_salina.1